MPWRLICDVHEWINVSLTGLAKYSVKPLPREWAWYLQWGKKTLLSLTLDLQMCRRLRVEQVGVFNKTEIPLVINMLFFSHPQRICCAVQNFFFISSLEVRLGQLTGLGTTLVTKGGFRVERKYLWSLIAEYSQFIFS